MMEMEPVFSNGSEAMLDIESAEKASKTRVGKLRPLVRNKMLGGG